VDADVCVHEGESWTHSYSHSKLGSQQERTQALPSALAPAKMQKQCLEVGRGAVCCVTSLVLEFRYLLLVKGLGLGIHILGAQPPAKARSISESHLRKISENSVPKL
jgi:hypothetical protein